MLQLSDLRVRNQRTSELGVYTTLATPVLSSLTLRSSYKRIPYLSVQTGQTLPYESSRLRQSCNVPRRGVRRTQLFALCNRGRGNASSNAVRENRCEQRRSSTKSIAPRTPAMVMARDERGDSAGQVNTTRAQGQQPTVKSM